MKLYVVYSDIKEYNIWMGIWMGTHKLKKSILEKWNGYV